ncbi:MAG: 2-polyprenyl-3-methyl-5-hydroxy-6-metoxy-1,4-benzoquinol methylase [Flavobacteriaceae bacterium]
MELVELKTTKGLSVKLNEKHSACPLCSSKKISNLAKFNGAKLASCISCSFIFSERIPSEVELDAFYDKEYEVTSFLSKITIARYNALLDKFEKHRKTNRILDVGCGYGFFLEIAKKRGWKVYGSDYAEKCIDICTKKGIDMYRGSMNDEAFIPEMFDVITSFEVIEHIYKLNQELQNLNRLLRPGGIMYVTTPNFNAILRYRLGEKYDVINYPEHLLYFTRKTLQSAMEKNGFKKLSIRTTGMSMTRYRTSKGMSNQEYVSETSDDEILRHKIEKRWHLKQLKGFANWCLNLFKIGDSLKATFVKL